MDIKGSIYHNLKTYIELQNQNMMQFEIAVGKIQLMNRVSEILSNSDLESLEIYSHEKIKMPEKLAQICTDKSITLKSKKINDHKFFICLDSFEEAKEEGKFNLIIKNKTLCRKMVIDLFSPLDLI